MPCIFDEGIYILHSNQHFQLKEGSIVITGYFISVVAINL